MRFKYSYKVERNICVTFSACELCHYKGHTVRVCPRKEHLCLRCYRGGHIQSECSENLYPGKFVFISSIFLY